MKRNRLLVLIIFFSTNLYINATCIYTKDSLYRDMFDLLVRKKIVMKNAYQHNPLDFIVAIDTVKFCETDSVKGLRIYMFYSRFVSEPSIFVLINHVDDYWVYDSSDTKGIFDELVAIQTQNYQLSDSLIVRIIKKINSPKRRLLEKVGNLKYVYDW